MESAVNEVGVGDQSFRLIRLYGIAHAIHRELLRLDDEGELFARSCAFAVESGEFLYAWLGVLDPKKNLIVPAAEHGSGRGYAREVEIVADESARGRGPTGTALRTGKRVVCRDIAGDPDMTPWRAEALRRGFRSSGAFPIARAGKPFGALNVYSGQPGFGDPREIEVLETLTEDIGFALDRLDRERASAETESQLRASEERYRTLVEFAGDGIFLAGADLRYVDVNPAACAMLGYTRDELIGKPIAELIDPDDLARRPVEVAQLVPGRPFFSERRLVRKNGQAFDAELHGVRLVDGRLQSVVRDVSARKRADAERAAMDRVASLGRLAQGVGHEINNPLAYLSLNLEIARARLGHDPISPETRADIAKALESAQDGAARIATIVKALNTFGRGEGEVVGPTDLTRVIDGAITLTANRLRHVASLELSLAPSLWVQGNEFRLGQVFVNLLLNAADAVEEIDRPRHRVTVEARRLGDGRVLAEVTDTGPGLAPEVLAHLFEPFFTTKPVGRGTGIGLSIAHGIVSSFGGVLEASNLDEGGASFRVYLPAADAPPAADEEDGPDPGVEGLRVLVVDDEPLVGRAIGRLLSEHQVTVVTSVRAALDRCLAGRYDAILCDVMLPEVGGEELHAALLERAPDQARRVAFMTGGAFAPDVNDRLARVPTPRLEKPFTAARLRAVLRQLTSEPDQAPGSTP